MCVEKYAKSMMKSLTVSKTPVSKSLASIAACITKKAVPYAYLIYFSKWHEYEYDVPHKIILMRNQCHAFILSAEHN